MIPLRLNVFECNFDQWRVFDCCQEVFRLASKVANTVIGFFSNLVLMIGEYASKPIYFALCIEERQQNLLQLNNIDRIDFDNFNFGAGPVLNDLPPDFQKLKAAIRTGEQHLEISRKMTAADFTELCKEYPIQVTFESADGQILRIAEVQMIRDVQPILEDLKSEIRQVNGEDVANQISYRVYFPKERIRIGNCAKIWAEDRTLRIDPNHPYFEIFQNAIALKNQIAGGEGQSDDYRTYSCSEEDYFNTRSLFIYIIYSLMGFQVLDEPDTRLLIQYLENYETSFSDNPAFQFTRALSKIFAYPVANQNEPNRIGEHDKLEIGIPSAAAAFQVAKQQNKVLEYFLQAFQNANCFAWRVSNFNEFILKAAHPNIEDFSPDLLGKNTAEEQALEYYRVFKNEQLLKMSGVIKIEFKDLQNNIRTDQGLLNNFYNEYFTKENFAIYLERNGQPLREKLAVPSNQPNPTIIPMQENWRGDIPVSFQKIPLDLIPEDQRQVGTILGVEDPNFYQATVSKRQGNRFSLHFSRIKANAGRHANLPVIDYQLRWRGGDEQMINVDLLPEDKRNNGSLVRLKDSSVYQVKVFAINNDGTATIDFRGEPVSRDQWQTYLPDYLYWTP